MKGRYNLKGKIGVTLVYLIGLVYSIAFLISDYKDFWSIVLYLIGGTACYIFAVFLHEAGHILLSKLFGFKVVGYSVGFIKIEKYYKKKVKYGFSDYAGETEVIPIKNGNFTNRYKAVIFGGIAGGFIACLLIGSMRFIFAFNSRLTVLFAVFPILVAWFIVNAVPDLISDSDGSFLKILSDGKTAEDMEKYLGILYNLNLGLSFSEINENLFSFSDSGAIYEETLTLKLLRAEELGDGEEIKKVAGEIKGLENRLADTDKELLVALALLGEKEEISDLKYVLSLCDGDDLRSMRTLIAYAFSEGDKKYLEVAKPTALKIAKSWQLKGEGKFTEILLEKF